MSNEKFFIEKRKQEDFAIRKPNSKRASDIQTIQGDAINRVKDMNPNAIILVERVRHTKGGNPDKWRKL